MECFGQTPETQDLQRTCPVSRLATRRPWRCLSRVPRAHQLGVRRWEGWVAQRTSFRTLSPTSAAGSQQLATNLLPVGTERGGGLGPCTSLTPPPDWDSELVLSTDPTQRNRVLCSDTFREHNLIPRGDSPIPFQCTAKTKTVIEGLLILFQIFDPSRKAETFEQTKLLSDITVILTHLAPYPDLGPNLVF